LHSSIRHSGSRKKESKTIAKKLKRKKGKKEELRGPSEYNPKTGGEVRIFGFSTYNNKQTSKQGWASLAAEVEAKGKHSL